MAGALDHERRGGFDLGGQFEGTGSRSRIPLAVQHEGRAPDGSSLGHHISIGPRPCLRCELPVRCVVDWTKAPGVLHGPSPRVGPVPVVGNPRQRAEAALFGVAALAVLELGELGALLVGQPAYPLLLVRRVPVADADAAEVTEVGCVVWMGEA